MHFIIRSVCCSAWLQSFKVRPLFEKLRSIARKVCKPSFPQLRFFFSPLRFKSLLANLLPIEYFLFCSCSCFLSLFLKLYLSRHENKNLLEVSAWPHLSCPSSENFHACTELQQIKRDGSCRDAPGELSKPPPRFGKTRREFKRTVAKPGTPAC